MTHIWFRQASDVLNHPRGPYATAEIRSSYAHHPLSSFSRLQGSINDPYRGWDPGIFLGFFPFSAIIIPCETDEIPASPLPALRFSHPSGRSLSPETTCRPIPYGWHSEGLGLQSITPTAVVDDLLVGPAPTPFPPLHDFLPALNGAPCARTIAAYLFSMTLFQTSGPLSPCGDRLSS